MAILGAKKRSRIFFHKVAKLELIRPKISMKKKIYFFTQQPCLSEVWSQPDIPIFKLNPPDVVRGVPKDALTGYVKKKSLNLENFGHCRWKLKKGG